MDETLYIPPKPNSLPAVIALIRSLWKGDGNLLELLPAEAYHFEVGHLGRSRRGTVLFNRPSAVKEIMRDEHGVFPKSDLMVGALDPLIGESMFVTDGPKWRRQRAMIDPAFSLMRLNIAYSAMCAATDDHVAAIGALATQGRAFSLDLAMSHLTADVICRTVFSTPLASDVAKEVFDDFTLFEKSVAQVDILGMILKPAWSETRQSPEVLAACERIRRHIGTLIDTHLDGDANQFNDIASAVIEAKDKDTGLPFTRDELIDQLGVFFLAGHETTASALTWVFYILAERPEWMARLRAEIDPFMAKGQLSFEETKKLSLTRAFFKEVLRLYPPITFVPRVALERVEIEGKRLPKGALVMIAPWTLQRHSKYWTEPHAFIPERFLPENEKTLNSGAYIPFGQGPHICVGAGFAQVESLLIMAQLISRFDVELVPGQQVVPAARLTTRPAEQVMLQVRHRC
ncbi:MAG: cytochrome P450 [Proteobacteria bacterium]|nr:cytochrome P450 [Pseudomonadota bacterium]